MCRKLQNYFVSQINMRVQKGFYFFKKGKEKMFHFIFLPFFYQEEHEDSMIQVKVRKMQNIFFLL